MNRDAIENVEKEAQRVLKLAKIVKAECSEPHGFHSGSKWSGALRRASLDLTRALAEMRKP